LGSSGVENQALIVSYRVEISRMLQSRPKQIEARSQGITDNKINLNFNDVRIDIELSECFHVESAIQEDNLATVIQQHRSSVSPAFVKSGERVIEGQFTWYHHVEICAVPDGLLAYNTERQHILFYC
jgi:hypothetical protein